MASFSTRELQIPAGATKVSDKKSDAVAYLYGRQNRPCAIVFFGKQSKPVGRYSFHDEKHRAGWIRQTFESRQSRTAYMRKREEERKAFVNPFKVGDVLNTCWGYDQTNREFYEVVAVKPKSVVLREIAQETIEDGGLAFSGKCVPMVGSYIGEPFMRAATGDSVKIDDVRRASKTTMIAAGPVKVFAPQSYSWGH